MQPPAEAEVIRRRKESLDRSPQERKALLEAAKADFEQVYRFGVGERRLVEGPRLRRTHSEVAPPARVNPAPTPIYISVPDAAREAELQQRIAALEAELRNSRVKRADPIEGPFNPVRIKTDRKLAVDDHAS